MATDPWDAFVGSPLPYWRWSKLSHDGDSVLVNFDHEPEPGEGMSPLEGSGLVQPERLGGQDVSAHANVVSYMIGLSAGSLIKQLEPMRPLSGRVIRITLRWPDPDDPYTRTYEAHPVS